MYTYKYVTLNPAIFWVKRCGGHLCMHPWYICTCICCVCDHVRMCVDKLTWTCTRPDSGHIEPARTCILGLVGTHAYIFRTLGIRNSAFLYVCMCAQIHALAFVCMNECFSACMRAQCVCAWVHVLTNLALWTCMHLVCMYVCICVCIRMHVCVNILASWSSQHACKTIWHLENPQF
jgi:hypothetical protein